MIIAPLLIFSYCGIHTAGLVACARGVYGFNGGGSILDEEPWTPQGPVTAIELWEKNGQVGSYVIH